MISGASFFEIIAGHTINTLDKYAQKAYVIRTAQEPGTHTGDNEMENAALNADEMDAKFAQEAADRRAELTSAVLNMNGKTELTEAEEADLRSFISWCVFADGRTRDEDARNLAISCVSLENYTEAEDEFVADIERQEDAIYEWFAEASDEELRNTCVAGRGVWIEDGVMTCDDGTVIRNLAETVEGDATPSDADISHMTVGEVAEVFGDEEPDILTNADAYARWHYRQEGRRAEAAGRAGRAYVPQVDAKFPLPF